MHSERYLINGMVNNVAVDRILDATVLHQTYLQSRQQVELKPWLQANRCKV